MASTNFIPNVTVIEADWLNDVNTATYDATAGIATAPPRTAISKFADIVSVKDFGAVGNDVVDDTSAIQAAVDYIGSTIYGGQIYFPKGLYKVTAPIVVKKDLTYFRGDGMRASAIRVYHDAGPAILCQHATNPGVSYLNGFGMSDMMIRGQVETNGNAALVLNHTQIVTLTNVGFEDHFGGILVMGGNNHYLENIYISATRNTIWPGPKAGSFFYKLARASGGTNPFEIYVNNFNFRWSSNRYIENGIVVNSVDGLWLSNGHVMGCSNADMFVGPAAGTEQITGIRTSNVWLDNNTNYGLYISGTTTAQFGSIEMYGTRFLTPDISAVFVDASASSPWGFGGLIMDGGVVHKSGGFGILLRSGNQTIISNMEFAACNTGGSANTGAISVQNAVNNVTINACQFTNVQANVIAPNMQGVRIIGTGSRRVVTNCNFNLDPAVADISDGSSSDFNNYSNNTSTKSPNISSVVSNVLQIPEIGDVFYVADALNFDNIAGRWEGRKITLVFAGISTVTSSVGGIRLAGGVNFVSKNGDSLSLVYLTSITDWIETGRMVA